MAKIQFFKFKVKHYHTAATDMLLSGLSDNLHLLYRHTTGTPSIVTSSPNSRPTVLTMTIQSHTMSYYCHTQSIFSSLHFLSQTDATALASTNGSVVACLSLYRVL